MISILNFESGGIDISDRAVKYVSFSGKKGNLNLEKYGEMRVPEGAIDGGVLLDMASLVKVLTDVRAALGRDYVNVSLPEEKGYVVEMFLPSNVPHDKERGSVELHLEERVPIEASNAVFDYEEDVGMGVEGGKTMYVTTVVEKEVTESYYEALSLAGFTPLAFELDSQAMARAVVERNSREVTMVVDVGREHSNLSVVVGEVVHLSSSVNVGGNHLAKAIEDDLGVSWEEAKKLKDEVGLLKHAGEKDPFSSIVRVATVLRDEIWQRLTYWESSDVEGVKRIPITRVFLCGGNANIPGLSEYLTSDMGLPVSSANPWVNILSFEHEIPKMTKQISLKYCAALGLALRENN